MDDGAAAAMLADLVHPLARALHAARAGARPGGPVSEQEFKTLLRLGENQGRWNRKNVR